MDMVNVVLDMKGLSCPRPLIGAKRMVDELSTGQVLLLVSDCPGTKDDLFAWAKQTGNQILKTEKMPDGGTGYHIKKGPAQAHNANVTLDIRGAVCPGPIVEAKKLLNGMQTGEVLRLISDCPGVQSDIGGWASTTGMTLLETVDAESGVHEFYIRKGQALRIKSSWFKEGREHSPQVISDALSFVVSRIADNALKNTRKSKFEIEVGPQYLDFLAEFLLFLILSADRIAYLKLSAESRGVFTGNLANRVAETYAENRSRLLDDNLKDCKQRFIDLLNQRAGEYADFGYDENGPDYGFYRYLAFCIGNVLNAEDANWVIDPMISFEAPEAIKMIEKTLRGLYEEEPKKPRRRAAAGGD